MSTQNKNKAYQRREKDGGFGDIKTHVKAFEFLPPKNSNAPQDNVWKKKGGASLFTASPPSNAGLTEENAEDVDVTNAGPQISLFTDNHNEQDEPDFIRTRKLSGEDRELIKNLKEIGITSQEAVRIAEEVNEFCQDDAEQIHKNDSTEDLNPPTKCHCVII